MTNKIELMEGADKNLVDLKQRLEERDRVILRLTGQLDEMHYTKQ